MKVGLIGLGPHGRRVAQVVQRMPGLELVGVVDRRSEAFGEAKLATDINRLDSVEPLWRLNLDLVCIATNGPSHAALTQMACEHGVKRVLVEKPMACSLVECDRMIASAQLHGVRLAVSHGRRFAPVYRYLHQQIHSGRWGTLRSVWMQRPGIGLGCNATHSYDLVVWLCGRRVEKVVGWVDPTREANPRGAEFVDPGGTTILDFGDGVRGIVTQIEDAAGPTSLEIDLTNARIRFDEKYGNLEIIERSLPPGAKNRSASVFATASLPAEISPQIDILQMLEGSVGDAAGTAPLVADGAAGRLSVEILVATYLSHRAGNSAVALPLTSLDQLNEWLPVT